MGLYDREYTQADSNSQFRGAPQIRMSLPKTSSVVMWLLGINIGVFLLDIIFFSSSPMGVPVLKEHFAVYPTSILRALQFWRLITYQFLHWDHWHLVMNMLGLFFLGPTLERHWGSKKFLIFYLGCGVAGGLFYLLLVALKFLAVGPMVGASGAILGMLAACAILFPQFVVFFVFFPVPIRVAAIILIFIASVTILTKGANAGGEAAHLAGMVAGAVYVFSESWRAKIKLKTRSGSWERKRAEQRDIRVEVDRILEKVHQSGIHSLTPREKKILKQATKAEQMRYRR